MERRVISEAIQEAIGQRTVTQLLFCTHDLDPEFFEQEVLPVFIGNDLKHNRRTRAVQLDYAIRQGEIGIDVYYENRALAAHEGAARLGWSRHKMTGTHGGVFHPKLVLALCEDTGGQERLLVCVLSANLTRGGWWHNVECGDIEVIEDANRHSFVGALRHLVDLLNTRRTYQGQSPASATAAIRKFLERQQGYIHKSTGGRLRPQLLAGHEDVVAQLRELFGTRLQGTNLEIVSPFFDGDGTGVDTTLDSFIATFAPRAVRVALPTRSGQTTISEEVFDAVSAVPGVKWASLPRQVTAAARGDSSSSRGVHAKVYRFWRGGTDPLEVIVSGSHNLTAAALKGNHNWEVSVIRETGNLRPTHFLDDDYEPPLAFECLDDDLETTVEPPRVPLSLAFDWATGKATAKWTSGQPSRVTVHRTGAMICAIDVPKPQETHRLPPRSATALRETLLRSCLVSVRLPDGREGPLLIEELNHELKPDLFEGFELTPAEIFALWSIPELHERLAALAEGKARPGHDEDDFEWAGSVSAPAPSMFERFAGVFHAFSSLRSRIDAAMADNKHLQAGRAMYAEQFDSPLYALKLVADRADEDLALAYVTYVSASLLDQYVHRTYPSLTRSLRTQRAVLVKQLQLKSHLRELIIERSDDPDMGRFLDWFDHHFSSEVGS